MKKFVTLIMALALSISCICALSACKDNNKEAAKKVVTGPVYQVKKENGKEYAILTKYNISEEDAKKIAKGDYELQSLEITNYKKDDGTEVPVTEIAQGALENLVHIKSITVGAQVEKIGVGAFAGCSNLQELTLPFVGTKVDAVNAEKTLGVLFGTISANNMTSSTVYYNSTASTAYYLPSSLKKVTVTGNVLSDYAFNGTGVKEVILSGAVTRIGEGAFSNMTAIGKVTIPATVTEIGKRAFANSSELYKVEFAAGSTLKTIYAEAFSGCSKLGYENQFAVPATLETVYYAAFKNCTSLTAIDLTQTKITEIPNACFYGCSKLKNENVKYQSTVKVAADALPEEVK